MWKIYLQLWNNNRETVSPYHKLFKGKHTRSSWRGARKGCTMTGAIAFEKRLNIDNVCERIEDSQRYGYAQRDVMASTIMNSCSLYFDGGNWRFGRKQGGDSLKLESLVAVQLRCLRQTPVHRHNGAYVGADLCLRASPTPWIVTTADHYRHCPLGLPSI